MGRFEVTICDLKHRTWLSALCVFGFHRTRSGNAVIKSAVHCRQYRDHARLRVIISSNKELIVRLEDLAYCAKNG